MTEFFGELADVVSLIELDVGVGNGDVNADHKGGNTKVFEVILFGHEGGKILDDSFRGSNVKDIIDNNDK